MIIIDVTVIMVTNWRLINPGSRNKRIIKAIKHAHWALVWR
jgi:hypothetical protein